MIRKLRFERDGLMLAGKLSTPDEFDENGHYNAICGGSFTSVKEQMPGTYAQKTCRRRVWRPCLRLQPLWRERRGTSAGGIARRKAERSKGCRFISDGLALRPSGDHGGNLYL